jgi:two-component system phosphate regulon sensor histidine kinase PhoR
LEYSGASPLNILADESKLYRLLVNILDNSIKHSPPLQIISIKVEQVIVKQQELVEIEMIDCGSGFAIEALPHVFDRFYQSSEQSSVNMQGGSGLGLAIAYQIVKAHKGTISVDNHPETGGAWIKVTLPIRQT